MQAVILAAGEGTRMRPLTLERPKPLIEVCGKPILVHIIEALPPVIDEVILVVSYKADMIRDYCRDSCCGRKISYVTQENPKGGTADALWYTQPLITGKFLIMYGDDIQGAQALQKVVEQSHAMLSARSENPERFGVLELNQDGTLRNIIEKPEHPPSNLVNIGGFVVTPEIFSFKAELSSLGEYILVDSITAYAQKYPLMVVEQETWIPLGRPDDVAKAEKILCPKD